MKSIHDQQPNQNAAHQRCEDVREPAPTGFLRPDEHEPRIACITTNDRRGNATWTDASRCAEDSIDDVGPPLTVAEDAASTL